MAHQVSQYIVLYLPIQCFNFEFSFQGWQKQSHKIWWPGFGFWQNQKPGRPSYTCTNDCRIIKLNGLSYFNNADRHVRCQFLSEINLFYLQIHGFYGGFITKISKESGAENGASSGRVLQHYFEAMAWMDFLGCFQSNI